LRNLKLQRLAVEQQDPRHEALEHLDIAIRQREEDIERTGDARYDQQRTGAAGRSGAAGGYWQCRVLAKPGNAMLDWSLKERGEVGWNAWYLTEIRIDLKYLACEEGENEAFALALRPLKLS
jgi:hypothetical protein